MARRALIVLAASAICCATSGCPSLDTPTLRNSPPAGVQQRIAERYDPFPEGEPGPAVEGARPRDYDRPWSEPVRSRWVYPNGRPMQPGF